MPSSSRELLGILLPTTARHLEAFEEGFQDAVAFAEHHGISDAEQEVRTLVDTYRHRPAPVSWPEIKARLWRSVPHPRPALKPDELPTPGLPPWRGQFVITLGDGKLLTDSRDLLLTKPPDLTGLDPFTAACRIAEWRGLFPERKSQ